MTAIQCGTRWGVDHRIDHLAGEKAWQCGTLGGKPLLPLRCKRTLAPPLEGGPLCWQARGPGFESPMLHQILISELALQRAECQEFERLTTKLTTCSSRSLVVKLGEIPPFSNSKLGTGGANGTFRAS